MPDSSESIVVIKSDPPFFLRLNFIIVGILAFVISFGIGFSLTKYFPFLKKEATNSFMLNEAVATPVSLKTFQNPMFSDWTAGVEGQVVSKTSQSFTIAHIIREVTATGSATLKRAEDNKFLEIIYIPQKAQLKKVQITNNESTLTGLNLDELSVGSMTNGTIEIYKEADKWVLIGKSFIVN